MSKTRRFGSSDKRLASTHPAVPPPTMTTSYSSTFIRSSSSSWRLVIFSNGVARRAAFGSPGRKAGFSVRMARRVRRQAIHRPPATPRVTVSSLVFSGRRGLLLRKVLKKDIWLKISVLLQGPRLRDAWWDAEPFFGVSKTLVCFYLVFGHNGYRSVSPCVFQTGFDRVGQEGVTGRSRDTG